MLTPDQKQKILSIRSDPGLVIWLPLDEHYEHNRQEYIRFDNWRYADGWLPCGDNWWRFP